MGKHSEESIRFRKNDHVGYADAESDNIFLENCYVDTDDLNVLTDARDPRCILLGRTGSGKTALLKRLTNQVEHCFEIPPEALSLNYISNSNVIDFFESVGVNLDPFYKLLWHHVLAVELIKQRFQITNEETKRSFITYIANAVKKDKKKEQALKYLNDWGDRFWEETESRIRNLTEQIETKFLANAGIKHEVIALGAEGAARLSTEEKTEIVDRGRQVVSSVQIRELLNVIELLAEDVFADKQDIHYLVIDRLDEDWADEKVRYKLIKALIESIKQFKKVQSAKIIIALRTDLKNRVIAETAKPGFQEEKYKSLYINLKWTRGQIRNVLDQRVNYLFEHQYTKHNVFLKNILPSAPVNGKSAIDYIIERTFLRPREAIIFLNQCIEKSQGEARIDVGALRAAEVAYSAERMDSLEDEWRAEYPCLRGYTKLIEHQVTPIKFADFRERVEDLIVQLAALSDESDPICQFAKLYMNDEAPKEEDFLRRVLAILYQVGVIGIKPDSQFSRQWSYLDDPEIDETIIRNDATVEVHLTFWAVLGVKRRSNRTG